MSLKLEKHTLADQDSGGSYFHASWDTAAHPDGEMKLYATAELADGQMLQADVAVQVLEFGSIPQTVARHLTEPVEDADVSMQLLDDDLHVVERLLLEPSNALGRTRKRLGSTCYRRWWAVPTRSTRKRATPYPRC